MNFFPFFRKIHFFSAVFFREKKVWFSCLCFSPLNLLKIGENFFGKMRKFPEISPKFPRRDIFGIFRGFSGVFCCFPAGKRCEFSGFFCKKVRKWSKMQKKRLQSETSIFAGALIPKLHSVKTSTQIHFFAINFFFEIWVLLRTWKREKKNAKKSWPSNKLPLYAPCCAGGGQFSLRFSGFKTSTKQAVKCRLVNQNAVLLYRVWN